MERLTDAQLDRAAELLRAGRVIAFPTDTVYGLGALDPGVERIYELKGRDPSKPLILMAADVAAFAGRAELDARALELARRHWPGPLTLVVPVTGGPALGIRVPHHPLALSLLRRTGPLWTTSANRSGEAEAMDAGEAAERLPGLDAVLDGGRAPGGLASTVLDLSGGQPRVLRQGPIDVGYR